jgi:hypothetical protein
MSPQTYNGPVRDTAVARDARSDTAARSLFHEVWTCGTCGRHFPDATSCCAHESQCGGLTRC